MTRLVLVLALVLLVTGCLQNHDKVVAVRQGDCALCHMTDYTATTAPAHATVGYPTSCAECHRTTSWQPALEGLHPEVAFPRMTGSHAGIACLDCHDLDSGTSSVAGANTNCIGCHPNNNYQMSSHVGALGPLGQMYAYESSVPNFCLTCHPKGTAKRHPIDRFPLTDNHNAPCTTCHDRSAGPDSMGMNVTCFGSGCHSISQEDGNHREESRYANARAMYPANKHFCLLCHPRGRN